MDINKCKYYIKILSKFYREGERGREKGEREEGEGGGEREKGEK